MYAIYLLAWFYFRIHDVGLQVHALLYMGFGEFFFLNSIA